MKKLVNGIIEFRKKILPAYREKFAQLALGQSPDTLFIACSDSRVAPNLFASTDPGDLFVVRNIGNMVPRWDQGGHAHADDSVAAAIEFSVQNLNVSDIVVCGHSECGAMQALVNGREHVQTPHLRAWLAHGEAALASDHRLGANLSRHNRLSQVNVLEQLEHVETFPLLSALLESGKLRLHGWWFDIARAEVYAFEPGEQRFVLIDESEGSRILERLRTESEVR